MFLMSYECVYSLIATMITYLDKYSILCMFIIVILFKQYRDNRNLPPGPIGLPYFGSLFFIDRNNPHSWYMKMADRYGEVFSVKMGNNLVVCISSRRLLKNLFYRTDSAGRPHTPLNELLGGRGIVLSEGALWKRQRQFLHEKFRGLGVSLKPNQRFEKFIIMEIEELLQTLKKLNGTPIDPVHLLGRHIHNVICQLMMNFRFGDNDSRFNVFNERVSRGMKLYGLIHIGEHVRHYMKLPGKKEVLKEIKRNLHDVSEFHADQVTSRIKERNKLVKPQKPNDLLDCYLESIEKKKESHGAKLFPNVDPENQIVQVMNDLFSTGMETVRTSLAWSLLFMIREPQVAEKVHQELKQVVTPGQLVTLEHRLKLPYVEAVSYETLRRASVVPLGTTHMNTKAWKIENYTIPEGTHIIPLINRMNMDPEIYCEPEKFKPERFILNGKTVISESFMQFGVGQRMCLGTQLARMEMFLFFANIMNNYRLTLPDSHEMPTLNGTLSITHAPQPYSVSFKKIY